jgi:hypothetical protein
MDELIASDWLHARQLLTLNLCVPESFEDFDDAEAQMWTNTLNVLKRQFDERGYLDCAVFESLEVVTIRNAKFTPLMGSTLADLHALAGNGKVDHELLLRSLVEFLVEDPGWVTSVMPADSAQKLKDLAALL